MSPKNPLYFRLEADNNLSRMQIRLVDEEGQQLNLNPGQATLIQLNLKRMEGFESSVFHVQVRSCDSHQEYPENRANKFTVGQ